MFVHERTGRTNPGRVSWIALACLLTALAFAVPAVAGGKGKGSGGNGKQSAGAGKKSRDAKGKAGDRSSSAKSKAKPASGKSAGAAAKDGGKPSGRDDGKARPRARTAATSTDSRDGGGAKSSGSEGASGSSGGGGRRAREADGKERNRGKSDRNGSGDQGQGPSRQPEPPQSPSGSAPAATLRSLNAGPSGAFAGAAPVDLAPGAGVPDSAAPSPPASGERLRVAPAASPVVRTVRSVVEVIPPVIWLLVGVLAAITLLLAAGSWLLAHRGRRLEHQREALLEDVGLLQRALLPAAPEQIAGVATSVAYRPATGPDAGGVFYDALALKDGRLGLLIGELSIGGRRSLGLTALVRHTLRAYLEAGLQPRTALQLASRVLDHQLAGEQASVTTAVYDREHGVLTYASAGNPPPVVLGTAGFEPITACASPPLAAGEPTGLRQTTVSLPPGSLVCFYTEGVVRATVRGHPFGYRRLWAALGELGVPGDARSLLERIGDEADDQATEDMAACLLRVAHHVPAAASQGLVRRVEELELFRGDLETDRPAEFLAACGIPSDTIAELIEEFRSTGSRLGGVLLRVLVGPGLPHAELALNRVELLPAFTPAAARA